MQSSNAGRRSRLAGLRRPLPRGPQTRSTPWHRGVQVACNSRDPGTDWLLAVAEERRQVMVMEHDLGAGGAAGALVS